MEELHQTFSNLFLNGKLCEAVQFFYEREKGGVLQTDELAVDHTGMINETVALVFEGKHPSKIIPSCATLETYEETPIFIPVNITEEAVESVAQKLLGSSVPGGPDSEALQEWLMKSGEDSTRLCTRLKTFVNWLANGSPPCAAYRAFMSGHLIDIDKNPGVRPVVVGETWWYLFTR